jgi:hypothetical protein
VSVATTFVGLGDKLIQDVLTGRVVALQMRSLMGAVVLQEMFTAMQFVVALHVELWSNNTLTCPVNVAVQVMEDCVPQASSLKASTAPPELLTSVI